MMLNIINNMILLHLIKKKFNMNSMTQLVLNPFNIMGVMRNHS